MEHRIGTRLKDRPEFYNKPKPVTFLKNDKVIDAISVMAKNNFGSVVVTNEKLKVIGIVTERDIVKRLILKNLSAKTTTLEKIMTENQDVIQVALDVATSELNPQGEGSFAKVQFSDGSVQNLDNFSAKRIAACYAQLDDTHKQQFQYMLNKDAASYQSALDFAVRNV